MDSEEFERNVIAFILGIGAVVAILGGLTAYLA